MVLSLLMAILLVVSGLPEKALADDRDFPIFPTDSKEKELFHVALEAYHQDDLLRAINETERLVKTLPKGPAAETAAYLLGDLHFKLGKKEGNKRLRQALAAYQEAQMVFPKTENAVRSIWKIGQVYTKLELYFESIASYRRVERRYPTSRFVPLARLGIARSHRKWHKWKEADLSYRRVSLSLFPPGKRAMILFEHAGVLYHLKSFEAAYLKYGEGGLIVEDLPRKYPTVLFQQADSAFRTKRYTKAQESFLTFYNIYPKETEASVALARVGDILRKQGKTKEAQSVYEQVSTLYPDSQGDLMVKIVHDIDVLFSKELCPPVILPRPAIPCQSEGSLGPAGKRILLQGIQDRVRSLLKERPLLPALQEILFNVAEELREHRLFDTPLEIQSTLLIINIDLTPFHTKIVTTHLQTMIEAIEKWTREGDDLKVVELFYSYPSAFPVRMMVSPTGLKVSNSHARLSLFSPAIEFYTRIAERTKSPLAHEALYSLGKIYFQQKDSTKAQHTLEQFFSLYPKSSRTSEALVILAEVYTHQGKIQQGIVGYKDWLLRNPRHPDRKEVSFKLAKAYEEKGNFKEAIPIYLKWTGNSKNIPPELTIKLADAYFQFGNYLEAIGYYRRAQKQKIEGKDSDWVQFRLAESYYASGKKELGLTLFTKLSLNANHPLLKELATERSHHLQQERLQDEDRRRKG